MSHNGKSAFTIEIRTKLIQYQTFDTETMSKNPEQFSVAKCVECGVEVEQQESAHVVGINASDDGIVDSSDSRVS